MGGEGVAGAASSAGAARTETDRSSQAGRSQFDQPSQSGQPDQLTEPQLDQPSQLGQPQFDQPSQPSQLSQAGQFSQPQLDQPSEPNQPNLPRPLRLHRAATALAGDTWPGFAARRVGRLAVSLAIVITASFAMIHLIPGDPVRAALGPTADPTLVAARRHDLGLDRPLVAQYGTFLGNLFRGRLGESIVSQQPVSQIISDRLPATLDLVVPAVLLVLLAAIPVGMAAAVLTRDGRRRRGEFAFVAGTGVLAALPEFLLAVGLVAVFGVWWRVFPVAGQSDLASYVLPVLALTVVPAAALSRVVRVEALRVLAQDYMRTARAKRLPARLVYLRHALPNLLTSSLTIGGLLFTSLLAGTVLVENVFAWPGLGSTIVQAITTKDYPLVQGVVLVYGTLALLITFVVDVAVAVIDPRSTIRGT